MRFTSLSKRFLMWIVFVEIVSCFPGVGKQRNLHWPPYSLDKSDSEVGLALILPQYMSSQLIEDFLEDHPEAASSYQVQKRVVYDGALLYGSRDKYNNPNPPPEAPEVSRDKYNNLPTDAHTTQRDMSNQMSGAGK